MTFSLWYPNSIRVANASSFGSNYIIEMIFLLKTYRGWILIRIIQDMIMFCRGMDQIIHREVKVIPEMNKYPPGSVVWEPHVNQCSRFWWVRLRIILRSSIRRMADVEYAKNVSHPDASEGIIPNLAMISWKNLSGVGDICNHLRSSMC
jgi:hypothetical protein